MSTSSGGGGPTNKSPQIENVIQNSTTPDQRTGSYARAWSSVAGGEPKTRTFEQILEDEKSKRNIIEIQMNKVVVDDNQPKSLTYEDIGELLFDVLKIPAEDCVSFNFNSGRYDQKEVKFKPSVDTTPYLRDQPIIFKDHSITVKKQRQNVTRVTFKNVPLNVPDEEILNLCAAYGKPADNTVHYETLLKERP